MIKRPAQLHKSLPVYLSFCLSICLSVRLSVYLSINDLEAVE